MEISQVFFQWFSVSLSIGTTFIQTKNILNKVWNKLQQPFEQVAGPATKQNHKKFSEISPTFRHHPTNIWSNTNPDTDTLQLQICTKSKIRWIYHEKKHAFKGWRKTDLKEPDSSCSFTLDSVPKNDENCQPRPGLRESDSRKEEIWQTRTLRGGIPKRKTKRNLPSSSPSITSNDTFTGDLLLDLVPN